MSPRVIGANLIVSIKSFYREKTAVFFRIAFPVILILVFGTIFMNQDDMRFDFYVQDLDGTNSSAELVKTLELNEKFKIMRVDPAIDGADRGDIGRGYCLDGLGFPRSDEGLVHKPLETVARLLGTFSKASDQNGATSRTFRGKTSGGSYHGNCPDRDGGGQAPTRVTNH
jgi:hypothetical protein